MPELKRQAPVQFKSRPVKTESRNQWMVVLEYDREGDGPWLVDLSHKTRWDFQDSRLDDQAPAGVPVPAIPGACLMKKGILANRMNRTQVAVWHLGGQAAPPLSAESGYTDVTEATVLLALFGPRVFSIAEKLSSLDFGNPGRKAPFLLQGPFSQVPCQIVTLAGEAAAGGLLFTCSRGYARDMVKAVLAAGATEGLRPAGEDRFTTWLAALSA